MKALSIIILTIFLSLTGSFIYGQSLEFNYIAPVSESEHINPEQSIILKTGKPFDKRSVENCNILITGAESGLHAYTWKLSEDLKTMVVTPSTIFYYGETVTVSISKGLVADNGLKVDATHFSFKIKTQDNLPLLKEYYSREFMKNNTKIVSQNGKKPSGIPEGDYKVPDDYPTPEMINYEETDDKYLFFNLNPRGGAPGYEDYLSINDKFGVPIFFRKTPTNGLNFHVMKDGRLAYALNDYGNPENEKYYFMDSSYVVTGSVKTGNGYNMDAHDMVLMDNGHYLLMSYDPQIVDMSQYVIGGNPNATVIGLVIQEVDINETVYFQWRSWDYFQITDATDDINLLGNSIDYVHGNAFAFDLDGNILLSSRHLDEITKIDYETGDIIYRFGLLSENNQFIINDDPLGFTHQHDVRVLPNGNITIFDNGNLHPSQFSQALEYSIDEITKTATRVWYYQNDPYVFGAATGSYRRAENGNNLIGWGSTWPLAATEITMNKTKTLEVYLPTGVSSYRTIKDYWVTNLFIAPEQLHFGNYEGTSGPKLMILPVYNNSANTISITSIFNHSDFFDVINNFPVSIPAGDTVELIVSFLPDSIGLFNDRLTLNYDKFTIGTLERIARQVTLQGIWDNSLPSASFLPAYGAVNVDPKSSIEIMFSEPIRKAGGGFIENEDIPDLFTYSLTSQWGNSVPFTGIISDNRQQITLAPVEPMYEQQQYFAELIPFTIEDDDGNVIGYPETTVFTTGLFVKKNPGIELNNVMVFPSPFVQKLVVVSMAGQIGNIGIYNCSGDEVFTTKSNKARLEINTGNFPEGIYFVRIINQFGEKSVFKILKVEY